MNGGNGTDREVERADRGPGNGLGRLPAEAGDEQRDQGPSGEEGQVADSAGADQGGADRRAGDPDVGGVVGDAADLNPLQTALAQRDEFLDSLRRLQAEFENYKKRVVKQQADHVARAAVSLVEKILPVLDTLDLAIEHVDPGSADGRALEAVSSQLRDVLTKEGLERISPIGEHFDPTAHEAVGHLPPEAGPGGDEDGDGGTGSPGPDDAGAGHGEPVVAEVMRAGYRWKGSMLRPAMVMVQG